MTIVICLLIYLIIGIVISCNTLGLPTSLSNLGLFSVHSTFWIFIYFPWGNLFELISDIFDIFD